MKKKIKILIVAAHADDEVLGVGGFISNLDKKKHEIKVVFLTNGLITDREEKNISNKKDAHKACKFLGIKDIIFLNYKDQRLDTIPISEIANKLNNLKLNPDIIFTHNGKDLNKDHLITYEAVKIISRPKKKKISLICFEIPMNNSWNFNMFKPNYYVDISKTLKIKMKALKAYTNENKKLPNPVSLEGIKILAQFRGLESGFKYAEGFEIKRLYHLNIFK